MQQRRTQTAKYWVEDFRIEQSDIDHLYNILLEREVPLTLDEMALILVRHRVAQEEEALARQTRAGNVYQPLNRYEVGDTITFPQLDRAVGTVVAVRPGENPDYGPFTVIEVEFENGRRREFASELDIDHPLNASVEEPMPEEGRLMSPEEIFIEYGGSVADALAEQLAQHDDLVRLAGHWFPRSLLVEVNVGHLNLAEAVLDMAGGGPMTTLEIIEQIGMLEGVNERLAEFSLNYALQEDERFDEVGPAGQVLWYLTRMEPEEVRNPPARLAYDPIPYDPSLLTPELKELELQIGDEHSHIPHQRGPLPQSVTVTLTYPHRRAGTLPLSPQLRRMFPTAYEAPRIRFTLIDAQSGEELPAWVVRPGGYVYGLTGWFEKYGVPVGGYLTISRTNVAGRVKINFAARSPRKEWVRTAFVEHNRLRFEERQLTLGCEYDDLMIINVDDEAGVDALWQRIRERKTPLEQIMLDIARELVALNPQQNFHAKTLYSAVNIVRRCPPGPIFANLVQMRQFEHVGGPYWRLRSSEAGV